MRKGFEWSVNLLFALILFIVAVGIFWSVISPVKGVSPDSEPVTETKACITDDDCIVNPDGSKCLQIYPGDFVPFCGCITNIDCDSGVCGEDNKCS